MIVYELRVSFGEIRGSDRKTIRPFVTLNDVCFDTEGIEAFDTLDDALAELGKYKTEINVFQTPIGKIFNIREYYVEEVEFYDNCGARAGDILGVSTMQIEVIDRDTYEIVRTFDNYADAERFSDSYDGESAILFP